MLFQAMPRPRSRFQHLGTALLLGLATTALPADEVRMHDGRVLVGKVSERGDKLQIATRDGVVVVASKDVARHRRDAELRASLAEQARSAGDSRFAHLQLAAQARAFGLEPELWQHLDRALALGGTEHRTADAATEEALDRHLADFLAQLGPELLPLRHRAAPTRLRVQELLAALRHDARPSRSAAIEELLVRESNADEDLRRQARTNPTPACRIGALRALERRNLAGNDRFVLRTAILDANSDVRAAAVAMSRPLADADVDYLATGLAHQNAKVRIRTAEALGELGNPAAVKLLVLAAPHAAKGLAADDGADGSVRGHIAIIEQRAYVRDFDVEVAAASFIADPQIDTLHSGMVMDVTVHAVFSVPVIVDSYRQALRRLTSQDPGADPRSWPQWLMRQRNQAVPSTTTGPR